MRQIRQAGNGLDGPDEASRRRRVLRRRLRLIGAAGAVTPAWRRIDSAPPVLPNVEPAHDNDRASREPDAPREMAGLAASS